MVLSKNKNLDRLVAIVLLAFTILLMVLVLVLFNSMFGSINKQARILSNIEKLNVSNMDIDKVFEKSVGYTNYDDVSRAIAEFDSSLGELLFDVEDSWVFRGNETVSGLLATLKADMDKKSKIAERYKSSNAIVNNSLYYMFSLHEQLEESVDRQTFKKQNCENAMTAVNRMLSLLYASTQNSYQNLEEYEALLGYIKEEAKVLELNGDFKEMLIRFALHGSKIIEYRQNIISGKALLEEQAVTNVIVGLKSEVSSVFESAIQTQKRITFGMFAVTIVTFLAFVYMYRREGRLRVKLKTLNEELLDKNNELELRYNELLTNKEIQKTQEEMLIQQSKMADMGEMIGVIGHQWKQPLSSLYMQLQMLLTFHKLGTLSDEEMQSTIDNSLEQVTFMSNTIDDFKNFFKPSKEAKQFVVSSAIKNVYKILEKQISVESIEFTMSGDNELVAFGYENEFRQVILNLINNAKDAIVDNIKKNNLPKDSGKIIVEIYERNEYSCIKIVDNGGGIPQSVAQKVFNPYFTTKGDKGTGIGLYVSKSIIENKAGGKLEFCNNENGAVFTISLPSVAS